MPKAWDREARAEMRGAVARADGAAVLAALSERRLGDVLQLAGDGLVRDSGQELLEAAARSVA